MSDIYIGLMSGTSLDGLDLAIVDFSGTNPLLIAADFTPYPQELLSSIKSACRQSNIAFDDLGSLDSQLGDFYALCIQQSLQKAKLNASDLIAIGSHGQTIQHSPDNNQPYTLQIGDANRIAYKTGISVVADFRRRDMAAGGQGAPLVPAFHQAVFQTSNESLAIVNIGCIANITFLDKDQSNPVIGFDCGPGNTLMDQWSQKHFNVHYDEFGARASSGAINEHLLNSLLSDPYFSKEHPKSTGPEQFNLEWLSAHLDKHPSDITDTLCTLCELTAISITQSLQKLAGCDRVLTCGGGVHNHYLQKRLQSLLECPVTTTKTHGVDPDIVEAMAFAWLAKQNIEGKAGNIPSVTGAEKPVILGAVYPA